MLKNLKYNFLSIIIFALLFGALYYLENSNNTKEYKNKNTITKNNVILEKCIDGDTAYFTIDGKSTKVRFLDIDAPDEGHELYEVVNKYVCDKLKKANNIYLESEDNIYNFDKYGRLIAWVYLDNKLLEKDLLEKGYAKIRYIYGKYSYTEKLFDYENIAKEKKIGLWKEYSNKESDKKYILTYEIDGKYIKKEYLTNTPIIPIDNPEKDGYIFSGWTYYDDLYDLSKGISKNITLHASWVDVNNLNKVN